MLLLNLGIDVGKVDKPRQLHKPHEASEEKKIIEFSPCITRKKAQELTWPYGRSMLKQKERKIFFQKPFGC